MQKLQLELKNTPTSTPQACSSVNLELNRVEKLSALDIKLNCNNPNVDPPQHTEGRKVNVYVPNTGFCVVAFSHEHKTRGFMLQKIINIVYRRCLMPIYEYQCEKCGYQFEEVQSIKDASLTLCKKASCCGKVKRLLSVTTFALKGNGWYSTDYGKGKITDEGSRKNPQNKKNATPKVVAGGSNTGSTDD